MDDKNALDLLSDFCREVDRLEKFNSGGDKKNIDKKKISDDLDDLCIKIKGLEKCITESAESDNKNNSEFIKDLRGYIEIVWDSFGVLSADLGFYFQRIYAIRQKEK